MSTYSQANRPVRIATPLEKDVLLFRRMTGVEHLGRPFQYELVLLSEEHAINYQDIIGQNVSVAVDKGDKEPRYFNGVISRFAQTNYERRLVEYRATMVPWLWFLTRSADCRIFQNLTVPQIIKQVFQDHGFSDLKERLHGTYKPWEYCVQYRETAFAFVSRLMEQEGIYYFFKHENGKHSLVLCDTAGSHLEFKGYEQLQFHLPGDKPPGYESIWSWVEQHEIQPGGYLVREFDFKNPRSDAVGTAHLDRGHAGSQFERFDYLGEMDAESDHDRYSQLRLEECQAGHAVYTGEGDARGVCPGVRFTLHGHPRKDFEQEYLTTGAEFRIESDPFETVEEANDHFVYQAKLTAIPVGTQFRAASTTPKPVIQGPQTAIVVGTAGEEIHTDKYGRVKVQFHWDRYSTADENSSCWVRVAQTSAGKRWGAFTLPRVGQEVVVEFLEGDPDRPLITGRVYNDGALPPYDLPAQKTISTIKSNTTKGGQGFNEIRFEDNKDKEQIFIHGQKDQDVRIKNDTKEWIGAERHLTVKKDQLEMVEGDKHSTVKGDRLAKTEGDLGETIKGDHLSSVDGNLNLKVKGDQVAEITGDHTLKSSKTVHLKAGTTFILEAGTQLSLKVGGNFVDIGTAGVTIQGTLVKINCGGSAGSAGDSSPTAPDAPKEPKPAAEANPGEKEDAPKAPKPPKPVTYSSSAKVMKDAAKDGTPFCEKCEEAKKKQAAEAAA